MPEGEKPILTKFMEINAARGGKLLLEGLELYFCGATSRSYTPFLFGLDERRGPRVTQRKFDSDEALADGIIEGINLLEQFVVSVEPSVEAMENVKTLYGIQQVAIIIDVLLNTVENDAGERTRAIHLLPKFVENVQQYAREYILTYSLSTAFRQNLFDFLHINEIKCNQRQTARVCC